MRTSSGTSSRLILQQRGAGRRPTLRPQALEERWILARIDAARARGRGDAGRGSTSRPRRARSTTSRSTTSATGTPRRSSRVSTTATTDAIATALAALERLLALLHPVLPHVTEEIWTQLPNRASRLIVSALARAGRRPRRRRGRARPRPGGSADLPPQRRPGRARERRRAADLRGRRAGRSGRRRRATSAPSWRGSRRRSRGAEAMLANERFVAERAGRRSSTPSVRSSAVPRASSMLHSAALSASRALAQPAAWLAGSVAWPQGRLRARPDARRCSPSWAIRRRAYPAIHVVGTNGKTTATRTIEAAAAARRACASARPSRRMSAGWSRADQRRRGRGRPRASARTRATGCRGMRGDAVRDDHSRGARRVRRAPRSTSPWSRQVSAAGYDATNVLRHPRRPAHERRARAHRRARGDRRGDRWREARRRPLGG